MDIDTIQQQLNSDKSLKTIAEELNTSQTNLRYWIKKYNLVRNITKKLSRVLLTV